MRIRGEYNRAEVDIALGMESVTIHDSCSGLHSRPQTLPMDSATLNAFSAFVPNDKDAHTLRVPDNMLRQASKAFPPVSV